MYDNLRDFFVDCVLADHDAYIEAKELKVAGLRIDLRLAVHTCTSMLHLADNVIKSNPPICNPPISPFKLPPYIDYLDSKCSDFKIVRDCANAHKHRKIDKHNPVINSSKQLSEVITVTAYHDEKGRYCIAEKEIRVELNDGTIKILHECIESVRNMWSKELLDLGVIDSLYPLPTKIQNYPPLREHDGENAIMNLTAKRSEGLKQSLIYQEFNYETMKAEVCEVDVSNLSGAIYNR
jgi:hypothetical protein